MPLLQPGPRTSICFIKRQDVTARERLDCFRRDPRLTDAIAAFCEDYEEPIFDRGHLAPRADMNRSESAMINTYMFSNMTPQFPNFNGGIWERREGFVRDWARSKDDIHVISGSVFDRNNDGNRDSDSSAERVQPRQRVAIPTHFYKIVAHERPNGFIETISIMLPHNNEDIPGNKRVAYFKDHITTVDEIERLTGINFFPDLEEPKQSAVERSKASNLWPTN